MTGNPPPIPELLGSNINSSTSPVNIERLKSTEYEKYQIENKYGFISWVLKALKNFADFSGRARRKEYWCFYLASTVFIITCRIILTIINLDYIDYDAALSIISFIEFVNIILIIPNFAVGTRRLHDVGQSGWWQLLWFIPVIGWIVILFLLCKKTSPQNNKWGLPAKGV